MSDVEQLKADLKRASAKAIQAKMDLHDLSEELPVSWETIPAVAARTARRLCRAGTAARGIETS